MIDAGRQAKDTGITEKYSPAMKIVEDVLQHLKNLPGSSLPDVHNLVRQVNRYREKFRPPAPVKNDKIFTLQKAGFPDNLVVEEIRVFINGDEVMHIFVATYLQLRLLFNCKTWTMDGTFKIVALPFLTIVFLSWTSKRNGWA